MERIDIFLNQISKAVSYNNYLLLWLIAVLFIVFLIILLIWRPRLLGSMKNWSILMGLLIILTALWFWIPKIKFYYDTRLTLPSYLSQQEKQQFTERWQEILNSTERGKNNSGLYNDIGILRVGYKDYAGAVTAFKLAISKNPEDARFYRNLAIAYTNMDNFNLAEQAFLQAFKVAPTQPEHWLELGELYSFKIKDQAKARLFYLEALSRTSDNINIIQAFAIFLENVEKDYPEAIKYWQMLADRVEENKAAFLAHIAELKLRQ